MTIIGTVVKGELKFEHPLQFPEAARVRVTFEDETKHLAFEEDLEGLRESIEDVKAGRYVLAREVFRDIAIRNGE